MTKIENFSRDYMVVNADTLPFSGGNVAVDFNMMSKFKQYTQVPVIKLSGKHYHPTAQWGIPENVVAVPEEDYEEPADPVLLYKDTDRARSMMGEQ